MINIEEIQKAFSEINKLNKEISDDFDEYLSKVKKGHQSLVDKVIQKDGIENYIGMVYEMALYYSYIFDSKIFFETMFNQDDTITIHRLYSEITQNILGIYGALKLGNILGSMCLCRTILERVVTLKIIFENPSNKLQVTERIKKYRNLGGVLQYDFAQKTEDQTLMIQYQSHFDTYSSDYDTGRGYFDYTQSIYGEKKSISKLLRDFSIDDNHNLLYGMLSIATHGSIISNHLLEQENGLLPSSDKQKYKEILLIVIMIMNLSIEDLLKYINDPLIQPIGTFLQIFMINLYEDKKA